MFAAGGEVLVSKKFTECRKWFDILVDQISLRGTAEWKMKGDCRCFSGVAIKGGDWANKKVEISVE